VCGFRGFFHPFLGILAKTAPKNRAKTRKKVAKTGHFWGIFKVVF
jgi:hypothetical protein